MKHTKLIIRITLFIMVFIFPLLGISQVPDPGGNPEVPIDGGLSLLLAAGVGYGVKKYRDHRKKQKEEAERPIE